MSDGRARVIEISGDQVAGLARALARENGHDNPDLMIVPGLQAAVFAAPFSPHTYYLAPPQGHAFPLWRLFEPAARTALIEAGRLAGVTFILMPGKAAAA